MTIVNELHVGADGSLSSPELLYKLAAPADGSTRKTYVEASVKANGAEVVHQIKTSTLGTWDSFFLFGLESHPPNGDYELQVRVLPGGDSKSLKVKLLGAPDVPAKFTGAIMVSDAPIDAKGALYVANLQNSAKTTFKSADLIDALASISTAQPQPSVVMTATWRRNGQQIGEPSTSITTIFGGLREFFYQGPKLAGSYEVTLAIPSTGESTKLSFTIGAPDQAVGAISQSGLLRALAPKATPDPSGFATEFDAYDQISVAVQLASGAGGQDMTADLVRGLTTTTVTYEGTVVSRSLLPEIRSDWIVYRLSDNLAQGSGGKFLPAGHYEFTLQNPSTGEQKSLPFTVTTDGKVPPTPTPTPRPAPSTATPVPTRGP